jgi:hypothetical protein
VVYYLTLFPVPIPSDLQVTLLGVFRNASHDVVFRWSSTNPRVLSEGELLGEGSGKPYAEWLLSPGAGFFSDTGSKGFGEGEAISVISQLVAADFWNKISLNQRFGFSYEVIVYADGALQVHSSCAILKCSSHLHT